MRTNVIGIARGLFKNEMRAWVFWFWLGVLFTGFGATVAFKMFALGWAADGFGWYFLILYGFIGGPGSFLVAWGEHDLGTVWR